LHEYAERRWRALVNWLPGGAADRFAAAIGRASLACVLRFYHIPQILFAPNPELIELVERGAGKTCFPMARGVDTELFNPARRSRADGPFIIGYVGRLTVEKNIRLLAEIEQALLAKNCRDFQFLIVGQGTEQSWLRARMKNARFTGVLRGQALAEAYANMDVFVFPSRTDTYGNVVLEAQACGVPTIVTGSGGPRFIVRPNETGFIANTPEEFAALILGLQSRPGQLASMRAAARSAASATSWDSIFESVYLGYEHGLHAALAAGKKVRMRSAAPLMSPSRG
jgi:phosphatidylinositol alpha 1,6-mannosyltransferase